jgi:hypothetical protein
MNKPERGDKKFVSIALDPIRRAIQIRRLVMQRMIILSLLVVMVLQDVLTKGGWQSDEIQNFRLLLMLLLLLIYNRIHSDVRLLKIVEALSSQNPRGQP